MEEIKKHSTKLMIAGAGGVALLLLLLSKKKGTPEKKSNSIESPKKEISAEKNQLLQEEEKLIETKNQLSEQKQKLAQKEEEPKNKMSLKEQLILQLNYLVGKQDLSIDNLLELYDKVILLISEEYQNYTKITRQQRRKLSITDENYYKLVQDYLLGIENMIQKYIIELLVSLDINFKNFEASLDRVIKQNAQNQAILFITREQIKEYLPKKSDVTIEKAKEIFKFQLKILTSKSHLFSSLFSKTFFKNNLFEQQLRIAAITVILFDYIHEEYNIEEEDLINLQAELKHDIDLMNIFQEIQNAMNSLLAKQSS